MPSVREYFVSESREYLGAVRDALAASVQGDSYALLRHARALRGAAQMAGEDAVARVATAFEAGARSLARGEIHWSTDVGAVVRETVAALEALVEQPPESGDDEDERVSDAIERWRSLGVEPALPVARTASRPAGEREAPEAGDSDAGTFRGFAAREAEGVLAALDAAIEELRERPTDREPLKSILRRQRALLGAAALDTLPPLAETLHAVDEVTRLVAERDPAVSGDWLEPYTAAREVLAWIVPRLRGGESLEEVPDALTRVRQARDRLAAVSAEAAPAVAQPPPAAATPEISDHALAAFRRDAGELLDRIRRLASELPAARQDRRAALRRELREAFTALSNNARTFRMSDAAALALTGRAWLEAGDPAALDSLLDRLRERIDAGTGAASTTPVPIEQLLYRGAAALRRALELRPALEPALESDPEARERLDELFDLIRLALE